ncbi:helix-turn-helix domain-containing protein [Planomonospora alba]|uniref:PucR family transcriptional regulator n=1 Tax=Planomonospora alba TaxID=161354 RepID=UPI0031EDE62F
MRRAGARTPPSGSCPSSAGCAGAPGRAAGPRPAWPSPPPPSTSSRSRSARAGSGGSSRSASASRSPRSSTPWSTRPAPCSPSRWSTAGSTWRPSAGSARRCSGCCWRARRRPGARRWSGWASGCPADRWRCWPPAATPRRRWRPPGRSSRRPTATGWSSWCRRPGRRRRPRRWRRRTAGRWASAAVEPGELRAGLDQADRALASARGGAGPVVRFADLAGRGLLSLLDPGAAAAFSAALLAPLREYGSRADLVESLRAYLACNGHWDAAAQRLGVHRHTLRYRMRRVAELLGRDLDDPATRAELWVALSV